MLEVWERRHRNDNIQHKTFIGWFFFTTVGTMCYLLDHSHPFHKNKSIEIHANYNRTLFNWAQNIIETLAIYRPDTFDIQTIPSFLENTTTKVKACFFTLSRLRDVRQRLNFSLLLLQLRNTSRVMRVTSWVMWMAMLLVSSPWMMRSSWSNKLTDKLLVTLHIESTSMPGKQHIIVQLTFWDTLTKAAVSTVVIESLLSLHFKMLY